MLKLRNGFGRWRNKGMLGHKPSLGSLITTVEALSRTTVEAVKWYRKAADQGNDVAQRLLGYQYGAGLGVPQSFVEAAKWYRRAAEQQNEAAQLLLGLMYDEGEGMPQDHAEAAKWYRKSADQGKARAQFLLAIGYEKGEGVPQDYIQAHMWFNLSASRASGDDRKVYADSRDGVATKMTAAQVGEAQRLAREWKPTTQK